MSYSGNLKDLVGSEGITSDQTRLGIVVFATENEIYLERTGGGKVPAKYGVPRRLIETVSGSKVQLAISEEEATRDYGVNVRPISTLFAKPDQSEFRIPLMQEDMNVNKKTATEYMVVRVVPITEMKTVQVPVVHQEIFVEKAPNITPEEIAKQSDNWEDQANDAQPGLEIKRESRWVIPITHEEIEVTKQTRPKEEIIITKVPVTEKRTIAEKIAHEELKSVKDPSKEN